MKDRIDKLGGAMRDLGDQAREGAARIGSLGELASEAARVAGDDVNRLMPAIRAAGYEVRSIDIDLAVPPKIAMHCMMVKDLPDEERERLLAEHEGNRVTSGALKMLFQVSDLRRKLVVGSLQLSDTILEIGINPGVKVRYRTPEA